MKAEEWIYKIDNVKLVLSRLKNFNFKEEEILNFDIFTAIPDNSKDEFINTLFEKLISTQNYKFNREYFNKVNNHKNYLKALSKYWSSFISEIQINEEFSLEDKINFTVEVIYLCSDEEIDRFNQEKCIWEYMKKLNFNIIYGIICIINMLLLTIIIIVLVLLEVIWCNGSTFYISMGN